MKLVNRENGVPYVAGYLDSSGEVRPQPGQDHADYAVDFENGVLVLSDAFPDLKQELGVLTQGQFLVSYSYATNYDVFHVSQPELADGEKLSHYYNRLWLKMDDVMAHMASAPRYVRPNVALMSLAASAHFTQAELFYRLPVAETDSTAFPTESYFAERSGLPYARLRSALWYAGDHRILLTRRGSTKYALNAPLTVCGPYPVPGDSDSCPLYYSEEESVIGTPQVTTADGRVRNPVSRTILLR